MSGLLEKANVGAATVPLFARKVPLEALVASVVQAFEVLQYWMLPPENCSEPCVVAPQVPVPSLIEPFTSSFVAGAVVPIPMLPDASTRKRSVPAVETPIVSDPLPARNKPVVPPKTNL